ncbi:hypothetical protein ILYODFUR_008012 [Ilyodon furcidens]|uniref:Uncharacterized protein n=1 Tax=Ilyodon furcidens TaxID=33524 RepID=A0ABV0TTB4_9TELE
MHRGQSHTATLHAGDNSAVWSSPVPTPPISHIKPRRASGGRGEQERYKELRRMEETEKGRGQAEAAKRGKKMHTESERS